MQPNNYLGIYLAKDHAVAVCLVAGESESTLAGCFSVSLEQGGADEGSSFDALARKIAVGCAEKQWKFSEIAVALDCATFMQHGVSSEFTDVKRITQTVRFDTEEALGTDVTNTAIAFKIDAIGQTGGKLSVFTAPKELLSEILTALETNNLDPVSIEPDVNCLARFVCQKAIVAPDGRPLFAFLSGRNGYFIIPLSTPWLGISPMPAAAMRTFLISSAQDRSQMLTRQVSMTTALLGTSEPVNRLEIFDTANSVNADDAGKNLGVKADRIDLPALIPAGLSAETGPPKGEVSPSAEAGCPDAVELAIAYGAALGYCDAPASASWRSDFMPFQGKKLLLQKTMKYLSVAASIFMVALGIYGFMLARQSSKYRADIREKFAKEYSAVMFGQTPEKKYKSKEAVAKLRTALGRVKDSQKSSMSLMGEDAVAGKLALVLQAFNKCASNTSLHIEYFNITDKSISISGDTSSNENTLKVFEAFRQSGLNVLQQGITFNAGQSTFTVTVEPRTNPAGTSPPRTKPTDKPQSAGSTTTAPGKGTTSKDRQ